MSKKARNQEELRGLESVLDTCKAKRRKKKLRLTQTNYSQISNRLGHRLTNAKRAQEKWEEANKATGWSEIAAEMRARPMEDFHDWISCIRTCIIEQLWILFVVLSKERSVALVEGGGGGGGDLLPKA
jgi:hypothetical protein